MSADIRAVSEQRDSLRRRQRRRALFCQLVEAFEIQQRGARARRRRGRFILTMAVASSDEDAEIAERLAALRERLTEVSSFTKHARESLTPARLQRARDEASSLFRTRREDAASPTGVGARRPSRALYFESVDAAPRARSRPSRADEPPLSPLRGHIRAARAFPDHDHRHHRHPARRSPHPKPRDHHHQSDLNIDPDPDRDPSVALGLDDDDDRDDDDTRRDDSVPTPAPPAVPVPVVPASAAQSILDRDRLHARVVRAEERAEAAAARRRRRGAAAWTNSNATRERSVGDATTPPNDYDASRRTPRRSRRRRARARRRRSDGRGGVGDFGGGSRRWRARRKTRPLAHPSRFSRLPTARAGG